MDERPTARPQQDPEKEREAMERWFDEVRLSSRPIKEIGIAFYIRELLGNNCLVNRWDVLETFGRDCADAICNLQRAGILQVEERGDQYRFSIAAPGDRKRETSKAAARKKREREGCGL